MDLGGLKCAEHRIAKMVRHLGGGPTQLLSFESSVALMVIGSREIRAFDAPQPQILAINISSQKRPRQMPNMQIAVGTGRCSCNQNTLGKTFRGVLRHTLTLAGM